MTPTPFARLVGVLRPDRPVVIQPHDFPDHDAVCAAYGLARLLSESGFQAIIRHRRVIPSESLREIIDSLEIPILEFSGNDPEDGDIVVIDSNPANGNVTPIPGTLAGIIDHHLYTAVPPAAFVDIRTDAGACCSIVAEYWLDSGKTPDGKTATALIAGIQTDTDFLTRRVARIDLDSFYRLYPSGDAETTARIIRSSLSIDDIPVIAEALTAGVVFAGCYCVLLSRPCSQETLAILADFLVRLREIRMAVIVETGDSFYRVSVRSKDPELNAANALAEAISGLGTGGGHRNMAGGILLKDTFPGAEAMWKRFVHAAWTGTGKTV